jgi:hypothetical protein
MSTKTRREKRKVTAQQAIETDWLWACPHGMPLGEIGELLGFTGEPRTELSAHAWVTDRQMRDDLYRALRPHISLDWLSPHVGWDALDDDLRDARADGRLMVLRELPGEVPHAVQMLIDIIGVRRREPGFHWFESRSGAHFALVLEGWPEAMIRVRSRQASHYAVRPAEGELSASQP